MDRNGNVVLKTQVITRSADDTYTHASGNEPGFMGPLSKISIQVPNRPVWILWPSPGYRRQAQRGIYSLHEQR